MRDYNSTKNLALLHTNLSLSSITYCNLEEKELISEDSLDESFKSCSQESTDNADSIADPSELKNDQLEMNKNKSMEELVDSSEILPLSQTDHQSNAKICISNLMDTETSDKIIDTAAAENVIIDHNMTSSMDFQNTPIGFLDQDLDSFGNREDAEIVEKTPILMKNKDSIKASDLEVSEYMKSRLQTDVFFIKYPTEYEKRTFEILKPIIEAHISQMVFESLEEKNFFYRKIFRKIHVEVLKRNLNGNSCISFYYCAFYYFLYRVMKNINRNFNLFYFRQSRNNFICQTHLEVEKSLK